MNTINLVYFYRIVKTSIIILYKICIYNFNSFNIYSNRFYPYLMLPRTANYESLIKDKLENILFLNNYDFCITYNIL